LPLAGLDLKRLDSQKPNPTPAQSSSDTGLGSKTMGISEKSLQRRQDAAPSSPPPPPVSHTPLGIKIEATNQMTVSSGENCLTLYKTSGPLGLLVRRLVSSPNFISTLFSLRWKPRATPQGRLLFQLVPSEIAPTGETGCGSSRILPTATCRDWKDTGNINNVPENGLLGRVYRHTFGENLRPEFSEYLMGLPLGHTALPASKPSETPSSHK